MRQCWDMHDGVCLTAQMAEMDRERGIVVHYFIQFEGDVEREVTKEEFVSEERNAGFVNTLGHPEEPGTAGFSAYNSDGFGVRGRVEYRTEREQVQRECAE